MQGTSTGISGRMEQHFVRFTNCVVSLVVLSVRFMNVCQVPRDTGYILSAGVVFVKKDTMYVRMQKENICKKKNISVSDIN